MSDRVGAPRAGKLSGLSRHLSRHLSRGLFWILAAVVGVLALYPRLTLPEPGATEGTTQYYNHVLAFLVLTLVGAVGWGRRAALVAGVGLGAVALELAQSLSPGRQTTLPDMAASLAGVAVGWALVHLVRIAARARRRPGTAGAVAAKTP